VWIGLQRGVAVWDLRDVVGAIGALRRGRGKDTSGNRFRVPSARRSWYVAPFQQTMARIAR
jgi:hypothetical protein